jgi:hypothetical protein
LQAPASPHLQGNQSQSRWDREFLIVEDIQPIDVLSRDCLVGTDVKDIDAMIAKSHANRSMIRT